MFLNSNSLRPLNIQLFIDVQKYPITFHGKYDIFRVIEGIVSDSASRPYQMCVGGYSYVFIHPILINQPNSNVLNLFRKCEGKIKKFLYNTIKL